MRDGKRIGFVLAAAWGVLSFGGEVEARDYLVNQAYQTAKQGEFELELWSDLNLAEADNDDTYNFRHQVELEYGLTDHLQVAYYEVYTWDRTQDWERDALKLEAKYRFAEAGQWPVDLALYTEYKNPDGPRDRRSDVIENKLILSKNLGSWNLVANLIGEKQINTHSDWAFEWAAGASYRLTPRARAGLEVKETLGDADEFGLRRKDHELYLIPSVALKMSEHVGILVGPAFGLTRASDDLQLKSIVEVEF